MMSTLQNYSILLVTVLFTSNILQGQNTNHQDLIRNLYDVLQENKTSAKDIDILSGIKWDDAAHSWEVNERSSLTFGSIIKKEWGSILFEDLNFQDSEKNKVIVTGIVKGRQPTECEYVTTRFKHSWDLKNGKIIGFKE